MPLTVAVPLTTAYAIRSGKQSACSKEHKKVRMRQRWSAVLAVKRWRVRVRVRLRVWWWR